MKSIAATFLLLICLPTISLAQINASFSVKIDNDIIEGYNFKKTGSFQWFKISGNNKELGEGTYALSNNTITLHFTQALQHFDVQVSEHELSDHPIIVIEVRAIHSNGPPLSNLKITLDKSNITEFTNSRGQATIEIKDPLIQDKINFSLPGFQTYSEKITLKDVNSLFGIVVDDNIKYRGQQEISTSFKKSWFVMILNGTKFKRISERKFRKLYEK